MNAPRQLSPESFGQAAEFLRQARPLEHALFAFHFGDGKAEQVRAALQPLQNTDGGFHRLEADIGFTASSVLSTCHALHILRELDTSATHPLVESALAYLLATYDEAHAVWPIIPPHDNSQPHAPWWHCSPASSANWQGWIDNPRPDVLACLSAFPSVKTAQLIRDVTRTTLQRLKNATEEMEMHGLLCYLRLHRALNLSPELKRELERLIPGWIAKNVERDPAKWTGYGMRPLDAVPAGDSPWRELITADIEAHLDYLLETQTTDGSWHPHWNWGDTFPEAWPKAKRQWQAVLTLGHLRTLRSYGRIAE